MPDGRRTDREPAVLDAFVHLADTLVDDYDVIELLQQLTDYCVGLAHADEAGVMLAAPSGRLQVVASSSERTRLLELFEIQNHDGPCLDAYRNGVTVVADDLDAERDRWPSFAGQATDVGFHAVHSVPLRLRDNVIGALNVLRSDPGGFGDSDARLIRALADIATIGVLQERQSTQRLDEASGLQIALTSRVRIEQAKGILAERFSMSIDDAFEVMRRYARRTHARLTDVATGVAMRRLVIDDDRTT